MADLLPPAASHRADGGAGWFGRAFLDAIARPTGDQGPVGRDGPVRVLAANPREVPRILAVLPEAVVHVGDVTDPEALADLFHGAAGASVVHAAGVIHPPRVASSSASTTRAPERCWRRPRAPAYAAWSMSPPTPRSAPIPTPKTASGSTSPIGPTRLRPVQDARGARGAGRAPRGDVPTVIVRPPWFYGPWQPERQTTFFSMVAAGGSRPGDGASGAR